MATAPVPEPPRQGEIWWSVAPPAEPAIDDPDRQVVVGISEEQLRDWLSCTAGWKALELTWGALQSCEVRHQQLKPLLQAAMAEAARLGASRLVVQQLDVDQVLGRCLALALSGFPNFTTLKLRELNLYDDALGHLSGALHAAEYLRVLVLDSVWASAGGWTALGAAIKVNQSLTTLRIRHCLGGDALAALCGVLADQHGGLEALRLSHNGLTDAGVEELCKSLSRSGTSGTNRPSRVAQLDLSHNGAGRQCVPALGAMLRTVRALRHLDLSYNDLGAEAVRDLCAALSYAPHLTNINLASTGADDSAVEALTRGSLAPAVALAVAASGGGGALAALCLAHNRISARGCALLAAAARRPGCALVEVDLGWNALIGEEGAKAWADALAPPSLSLVVAGVVGGAGPCRLRRLVLSGCEVPDAGAFALGAALKTNSSLQELGLAENHISTRGLALLAEVLKVNSTLRLLDVSLNMVGPQGMAPLSRMSRAEGSAVLSKTGDRAVGRLGTCVVKAELLREYRAVEAVKNSSEPWERESKQQNPFLNPSMAAAAATGLEAAAGGSCAGGGAGLERGSSYNPFLSPTAKYVNPFLDPAPAAAAAPAAAGGHDNPFVEERGAAATAVLNPFVVPQAAATPEEAAAGMRSRPDNPFLFPPPAEGEGVDNPFMATAALSTGVEGRQLSTRALTKLGSRASDRGGGTVAAGSGDGCDSGSGTGVYVSSRSTADEADLATELDLKLVDHLLENLGMTEGVSDRRIQRRTSRIGCPDELGDASAAAGERPKPLWMPPPAPPRPHQADLPRADSFWSDDESPAGLASKSQSRHASHAELQWGVATGDRRQAIDSKETGAAASGGRAVGMAQSDELTGRGTYEQSYEGHDRGCGYGAQEADGGGNSESGQGTRTAWGRGEGGGLVGGRAGVGGAPQGLHLEESEFENGPPAPNPFL